MKKLILLVFLVTIASTSFGYVYNLVSSTNLKDNLILIQWYGPTNLTGSLYYNVYSSTNELTIQNNRPINLTDFQIIGTLKYSTNDSRYSITDSLQPNKKYVIIPVLNGEYIYENISANVIPQTQFPTNTNITTSLYTDQLKVNTNTNIVTNTILTQINLQTNIPSAKISTDNTMEYTDKSSGLSKIVREYFLKRDYRTALEKLRLIREEVETQEQRDLIDVYIARSYYALNKRKKAIYVLLRITSEEVRPLAEFWLDRFSKYYR